MKNFLRILLVLLAAASAQTIRAINYSATDLLLTFRQSGFNDVEFDIGTVSNFFGLTPGIPVQVSYDTNAVVTNHSGSFSNVRFSVVGATSLGDPTLRLWASDANLGSAPTDVTVSKFSALRGKIESVGNQAASLTGGTNGTPLAIAPSSPNSYSYIVSGGAGGSTISTFNGDMAFPVDAVNPTTLALYEVHPSGAPIKPPATLIGAFAMQADGKIYFTPGALPGIVVGPANKNIASGQTTTLTVSAIGGVPATLTYQWYQNGVAVSGATNSSLTLSNATPGNAGQYTVAVSNSFGGVTSSAASVAVTYSATDVMLVFRKSGSKDVEFNLGSVSNYLSLAAGAVIPVSYDTNLVVTNFSGSLSNVRFSVIAATSVGDPQLRYWSSDASLVVIPTDVTVSKFSALRGKVEAVGSAWSSLTGGSGQPLVIDPSFANSYSYIVSGGSGSAISSLGGDSAFAVDNITPSTLAVYEIRPSGTIPKPPALAVGSFTIDSAGNLTFAAPAPPTITVQPLSQDRTNGQSVTFAVSASNILPSYSVFTYQWYKDDTNVIAGATNSTLTLNALSGGDAGQYSVVVANAIGSTTSDNATLTVFCSVLTLSPASLTNGVVGSAFSQTITASGGVAPYTFTNTSGSLPAGLNLASDGSITGTPTTSGVANFTVTATDTNGCTGSLSYTLTIGGTTPPVVVIKSPKAKAEFPSNVITVSGTALDMDSGISQVLARVNGGVWTSGTLFQSVSNITKPYLWTNTVTLATGTNVVEVRGVDNTGRSSTNVSRVVFLQVLGSVTITDNGSGTHSTEPVPALPYYVGRTYFLDVTPSTGNLFSNIVSVGSSSGTTILYTADPAKAAQKGAKKIPFLVESNLTLTINFVTNRFAGAAGLYFGLFRESAGAAHQSAGWFQIKTDDKLKFTGKLLLQGEVVPFGGTFDLAGNGTPKANKIIARKGLTNDPLTMALQLDLSGSNVVNGTLTSSNWSSASDMLADKQVYGAAPLSAPPSWLTTSFALVMARDTNAAAQPGGDGYLLSGLDSAKGIMKGKGYSGDGQKGSPTLTGVSANGDWPFYFPLYKSTRTPVTPDVSTPQKTYLGSISGWLSVSNGNVAGDLVWNRPSNAASGNTNALYTGGFTNLHSDSDGSLLSSPFSGPGLPATGTVTIKDGNLASPIVLGYQTISGKIVVDGVMTNGVKVTIKPTGEVSGSFGLAPSLKKTYGVLLQQQGEVHGLFLGTDQSGSLRLP